MTDPRQPSADEVRALVRRIVDQTLDSEAPIAAADGRTIVAIAGDHGGWRLKDAIGAWLEEHGYVVRDCGTNSDDAVDYPDFALAVAQLVSDRLGLLRHRRRRRRHRLGHGRQQGARRTRRQLPRHLVGSQQPRAQLRQRADAGLGLPGPAPSRSRSSRPGWTPNGARNGTAAASRRSTRSKRSYRGTPGGKDR